MNNQMIDRVISGELLERLLNAPSIRAHGQALDELRALVEAPVDQFNPHGWSIDHSAGRPILVHNNCSVIEAEQAYGLLELIEKAAQPQDEPVAALEKARDVLRAIIKDKAAGVHYASAQAACHQINHALEQPAPVAAARMCDCNQGRLACSCRP